MRILFLTPYVPSLRAGGEKFTKLLLEDLSKEHQIDLIYFKYDFDKEYDVPNSNVRVLKVCKNSTAIKLWNALKHPFLYPTFSIRFSFRLLWFVKKVWKKNNYDLLYLDHSQMLLYGKYFPKVQKILMSHDVMAERYGDRGALVSHFVRQSEKKLMSVPNTTIFTFSEKDVNIVQDSYGVRALYTNFYLDESIVEAVPKKITDSFVFFGKWKRPDNFDGLKWFFENVYPLCPQSYRFSIMGIGMPKPFEAFLKTLRNVKYLGFVENPYEIIAQSKALISPIFSGAGVKVKVVESLACGTPVVGNELAFEGISRDFANFMNLANSAEEYKIILDHIDVDEKNRCAFKNFFLKAYSGLSITSYLRNWQRN